MSVRDSLEGKVALSAAASATGQIPAPSGGRAVSDAHCGARIWQEPLHIPTYAIGPPERVPIFFAGRAYQRAAAPAYPYPMLDDIRDRRADREYQAVYLENRYLRVCVLPELGGRIFSALDKTNQYDFIYRQGVIKPALVGMLGAWISGGVEWDLPHHHRATTFMPVQYRIEARPDGSSTVWLGELEWRHRMRWTVGLTIHSDKSYIGINLKIANMTPAAHSMLCFANIAVHVNEHYQVIFSPTTQYVTNHSKKEFSAWPVSHQVYNEVDFRQGVDVSMWRNHPSPVSMFAWDDTGDFVAGYDHSRDTGTVHVANHHFSPGKKFFTWGNGSAGRDWDAILTEHDGAYIELMAGSFSDNQPDYSWIYPYETREVEEFLFPVQRIGGIKKANRDAAVNLTTTEGHVRIGVAVTSAMPDAVVRLRAVDSDLLEQRVALGPDRPYVYEAPLPAGVREHELWLCVRSGGREIITYTPPSPAVRPMPVPVPRPPLPGDIPTVEELDLQAGRLDQLHNAAIASGPYWAEALRRDPHDIRANIAMGIDRFQRGLYDDAKRYFSTAIAAQTFGYVRPKDAEAHYYLGLTLKATGDTAGAVDELYKAAWSLPWKAAAYYELSVFAFRAQDFSRALEFAERAQVAGNNKALWLKSVLLRCLDRPEQACKAIRDLLASSPLDPLPAYEASLAGVDGERDRLISIWRSEVQSFLELSLQYADCGLWSDASGALSLWLESQPCGSAVHPMAYYYLGYFAGHAGCPAEALRYYRLGRAASPDYCFPFRLEEAPILRAAIDADGTDPRAPFYLGNVLYDVQPEAAIRAWETARDLDPKFAMVHRNLAWGYSHAQHDLAKAISSLETAISCDRSVARFYVELDELHAAAHTPLEARLNRLEDNPSTVLSDDAALAREVSVLVQMGRHDDALRLMAGHMFHVWEGGGGRSGIHAAWVDANLAVGHQHFACGQDVAALASYQAALEYPAHLGTPRPDRGERLTEAFYCIGLAQERLGHPAEARQAFESAVRRGPVDPIPRRPAATELPDMYYYFARALESLGRQQTIQIGTALIQAGEEQLRDPNRMDFFVAYGFPAPDDVWNAQAHYAIGLGRLLMGSFEEARAALERAVRLDGSLVGARYQLTLITKE